MDESTAPDIRGIAIDGRHADRTLDEASRRSGFAAAGCSSARPVSGSPSSAVSLPTFASNVRIAVSYSTIAPSLACCAT